MSTETKIEWCDHTFNPWIGCAHVSPGCTNCYAETLMDTRYGKVKWGKGKPRVLTSEANWKQPLRWDRAAEREGVRRRVFCSSLADVWDADAPEEWRVRLFDLIGHTPHLDWLLLTKRPENIGTRYLSLPNVWLGTSVEDQQRVDERVSHLLRTPATVHFLSVEPLLAPVTFRWAKWDNWRDASGKRRPTVNEHDGLRRLDWVIVGGESGPRARPCNAEWIRDVVDECQAASVPCFVKQLGAHPEGLVRGGDCWNGRLRDRKGGDMDEWPADLRVRQFPQASA